MYVPAAFAETDVSRLYPFIEQHSFATLVSNQGEEPIASHLPLLLQREVGQNGSLLGHFARANPQAETPDNQSVLAIFHGPHAYISPTWYASQNTVPTWNYQAVHVYGRYSRITDDAELKAIIAETVRFYEASQPEPWSIETPEAEFTEGLLKGIVGFRIEIERIEGKFKLSQNHPEERRQKVIDALKKQSSDDAQAIAALMEADLPA